MYQCVRARGTGVGRKGKRDGKQRRRGVWRSEKGGCDKEREREKIYDGGGGGGGVEVVEKRSSRKKETEKEEGGGGRTERAKSGVRRGGGRRG